MDIKFEPGHAALPYKNRVESGTEENPGTMDPRDPDDLNRRAKPDAKIKVALTRHHLFPGSRAIRYWNYAVDHYYKDDREPPPKSVSEFLGELRKQTGILPLKGIESQQKLDDFLAELQNKEFHHDSNTKGECATQLEEFGQIFFWCPGNLVIGPSKAGPKNPAGRVDDPGEDPEAFLVDELEDRRAKSAARRLLALSDLTAPGEGVDEDKNPTLANDKLPYLLEFYQTYRYLFSRAKYPQDVTDAAWSRIPENWYYVTKPTGPDYIPSNADYIRSTAKKPLRQARSRDTRCPPKEKLEKAPRTRVFRATTVPTSTASSLSISVKGSTVTLTLDDPSADGTTFRRYRGGATGISMSNLLKWAEEEWHVKPDIPPFIQSLALHDASFEVATDDPWKSWKIGLGVTLDIAGVKADAVVTLEWATGGSVAVTTHLALRDHASADSPMLIFSGGLTRNKTNDTWELGASLATAEPVELSTLARRLGIPDGEIPDIVKEIAPAITEADLRYTRGPKAQDLAVTVKTEHGVLALATLS
ncbi:hypothetical protein [Kitasatospora sp. NPDC089509]|uniref:hypothetical protein n=1 Tax=Kitasatospora sp. NPDC089509 TaxID=3364079 RepID=UPI0037F15BAE